MWCLKAVIAVMSTFNCLVTLPAADLLVHTCRALCLPLESVLWRVHDALLSIVQVAVVLTKDSEPLSFLLFSISLPADNFRVVP